MNFPNTLLICFIISDIILNNLSKWFLFYFFLMSHRSALESCDFGRFFWLFILCSYYLFVCVEACVLIIVGSSVCRMKTLFANVYFSVLSPRYSELLAFSSLPGSYHFSFLEVGSLSIFGPVSSFQTMVYIIVNDFRTIQILVSQENQFITVAMSPWLQ